MLTLYSYWRSQAAYRVRIALHLKRIEAQIVSIDLIKGEQFAPSYRAINAEAVVPSLVEDGQSPLMQSLAIIEYLNEQHPEPPLLPKDARARAYVRGLAQIATTDTHPLIVPRVRKYLDAELKLDEPSRARWLQHWLDTGSQAIEETLARSSYKGRFSCGDVPTIADLCVVAHLVTAQMLCKRGPEAYPNANRVYQACMALDAFSSTHPLKQPGAEAGH